MILLRKVLMLVILMSLSSCKEDSNHASSDVSSIEVSNDIIDGDKKEVEELLASTIVYKNVKIDSISIQEMKRFVDEELPTIFDYYNLEKTDDYLTWSTKLFGRCCSNTDLSFTENLFYKISSNYENNKYPGSNLSDNQYLTAYAFKKDSDVKISLALDLNNSYLTGEFSNQNLLTADDTIMNPIRLSLINGYVKTEALFHENGRVKEMELYVNDEFQHTVYLMDTPNVQEITINSVFKTNDVITLIPISYYFGEVSDDICISEIQTNLGKTALPSLNEKFNLIELLNKKQ